ncbi:MAG: molybdopterin oxidoreductase family protein [Desulfomonilaceae bacterium]
MANAVRRSVCPYDCPDTCGLLVEVADGKAVKVTGDPDHPFTRGFLCSKMNRYQETAHSLNRLTSPLLRTGRKGSGQFRRISWPEAIIRVSTRWREIIAKNGAEAILPYSYSGTMGIVQRNAGHPFFYRLGASRLDRTICSPAKEAGWKAVMGGTVSSHPDEVMESDLVILWGIDALATNIHFLHGVQEARKKGAKVWVIDTYETPTAGMADRTFLVSPGSDGALALGMMHVLVAEGLVDQDFLGTHVKGFDELCREVLSEFSPGKASLWTGLPVETIRDMARAYGKSVAPFIRLGSGLSRYANGAMTCRTIVCLPALVGAWAKRGGGLLAGTASGSAFSTKAVTREDFMVRSTRIVNMNQLGRALTQIADPPVLSLYVYHANPAAVTPDQNQVLMGLSREDLFTVVHERFMTDTAAFADIVLPATSSMEHSDLYRSYGTYCIQRARPVIRRVGESKSNWEVFGLLAEAMGFDDGFFRQSADDLIEHLLSTPSAMREGIDSDALDSGKAVELRLPTGHKTQFRTDSGKIQILNPCEQEPLPRYIPSSEGTYPLRLMTAPARNFLNSSFRESDDLRAKDPAMLLRMNPSDAGRKGLKDGERVSAFNDLGEVSFILSVTSKVPEGVVVADGIWWLTHCPGERSVNALTSQRLTDRGAGSTFYDNTVDVRKELRQPSELS